MIGSMIDQRIFEILMSRHLPELYNRLQEVGILLQIISFPWFMTMFMTSLPYEVSARVLDCFFYEGRQIFFKVGLALFKMREAEIMSNHEPQDIIMLMKNKNSFNYDNLFEVFETN